MAHVLPPPPVVAVPVADSADTFPVRRVYCVGRNYVEHAIEMGHSGREAPFFFMKPADAVVVVPEGDTVEVAYPPGTADLHHEIELVVAIGAGGANIAAADAGRHVWGYAVGLDMTRRDLQGEAKKQGRPWEIGKAFDESAPIGPIRRATGGTPLAKAAITLDVNGAKRQASDVAKLIWNIGEIIEHLSKYWRLEAGDLIFTGTPEGVAAVGRGDLLEGRVEGVGGLRVRLR